MLNQQPYDAELLRLSPLYRQSRRRFLKIGGSFSAALRSTPRALSSDSLLLSVIEYSPISSELAYALATKDRKHFARIRTYATSVFHEQSHRILWHEIPPPPRERGALRRYLNLTESLVIAADSVVSDQLTLHYAKAVKTYYQTGVLYDPGTPILHRLPRRGRVRTYRNYLHALSYATFLLLEGYRRSDIYGICSELYGASRLTKDAITRALQLDAKFVRGTNPRWQKTHRAKVPKAKVFAAKRGVDPLALPIEPIDNRLFYLTAEKWFSELKL